MDYVRFGQTGLKVSQLCLGTMSMGSSAWKSWVLDETDSVPILRSALDLDINFFDMADWYSTGRNEEVVARAIARSPVPVISAVGHETDFTILDFVSDQRAPTPSAAAELVIRSRQDIEEELEEWHRRLGKAVYGLDQFLLKKGIDSPNHELIVLRKRASGGPA